MPTIKIESILGGHSPTTNFAALNQFRASLGIDPAQPLDDTSQNKFSIIASGLLRPVATEKATGDTITGAPLWFIDSPKANNVIYLYDINGSLYTIQPNTLVISAKSDGGSLSNSNGNGGEYYDNYIYLAKNTTIARYGPLDGVSIFDGDYWGTTLAKAPLTNTSYPNELLFGYNYPNHVLHRHSDGNLYIADVQNNQGTIHYISTKKTTVEGDTDNGSTASKLQFGYGLWPTAIESYGTDLVIALVESINPPASNAPKLNAKIGFWDTISNNVNKIIWVEFPDQIITAVKNIDGVLYVFSGSISKSGIRITKFVGGYTFEEVLKFEDGEPPFAGAVDGNSNRLLFGNFCVVPENGACIYSYGLSKKQLGQGLFNIMNISDSGAVVSAVRLAIQNDLSFDVPMAGWAKPVPSAAAGVYGVDFQGSNYGNAASVFWSQTYRIGQPFQIDRIRIPLAQAVAANMKITPKIYFDDGIDSLILEAIDTIHYPNSERNANIKIPNAKGYHNFWLELRWTGSQLLTVSLPITIEYHLIDD